MILMEKTASTFAMCGLAGALAGLPAFDADAQRARPDLTWKTVIADSPLVVDERPASSVHVTPIAVSRELIEEIRGANQVMLMGVPLGGGEQADLDMTSISVTAAPDAKIVNGRGPVRTQSELGLDGRSQFLGGEVAGAPGSKAFLAITPTGVNGFVQVDGQLHVITNGDPTQPSDPVVYNMTTLPEGSIHWASFVCNAIEPQTMQTLNETEITAEAIERHDAANNSGRRGIPGALERARSAEQGVSIETGGAPTSSAGDPVGFRMGEEPIDDCRILNVAIEVDQEFGDRYESREDPLAAVTDYVDTLIAANNFIYGAAINVQFRKIYQRTWLFEPEGSDPWEGFSTADLLFQLQDEWTPTSAPDNVTEWRGVHLLSGRNLGGGIAFLRAMCNKDIAHAVSADLFGSFPVVDGTNEPISNQGNNWDIVVTAHEWGHNLGAPHTHGTNPTIDGCGLGDCTGAENGTIMSYCHLCPGGLRNIELVFDQRIINEEVRPYIETAGCNSVAANADACVVVPEEVCAADINGDMQLTPADFVAWVVAYNAGDLVADLNGDGRLLPNDFNAWLNLYNAGCEF
ncbi:MAG: M12 family metallo-peptidase [Planctomycetota bacterium]